MGLVAGINIAVGFFAVGGATVGDFTRYARDRKGAVLSSIIGIWPPMVILLMMGAMLSVVKPESGGDISQIMASMGLAGAALIALVLSTWSVNVGNAYSAGLAFAVIADKGDKGYRVSTTIAGILGIMLAVAGHHGLLPDVPDRTFRDDSSARGLDDRRLLVCSQGPSAKLQAT